MIIDPGLKVNIGVDGSWGGTSGRHRRQELKCGHVFFFFSTCLKFGLMDFEWTFLRLLPVFVLLLLIRGCTETRSTGQESNEFILSSFQLNRIHRLVMKEQRSAFIIISTRNWTCLQSCDLSYNRNPSETQSFVRGRYIRADHFSKKKKRCLLIFTQNKFKRWWEVSSSSQNCSNLIYHRGSQPLVRGPVTIKKSEKWNMLG